MAGVFDAVLTYQFIRKLTMPFNQMPAYKINLIDDKGNFLKPRNKMTPEEKKILGIFDVMVINLKKLIAKVPGGGSRLGTIAATMLLLRTKSINEDTNFDYLEKEFFDLVEELKLMEDGAVAVNSVGSGDIAGLGVPAGSYKGFPPVSPAAANKYKKANIKGANLIRDIVKKKVKANDSLNESFTNFISESTTLKYHKELNPKLWDTMGELKTAVRDKLLQIADAWVAFTKISPDNIYDVVITGGNVNYNYTDSSDIDLHIIISRNAVNPDRAFVDEYLQDKKILWTLQHPNISIYGYPVELYAQDMDEKPHANQGVYSLVQNRWIARPQMLDLNFEDDYHLQKKVQFYKDMIDQMIQDNASDDAVDVLRDKFKKMRSDCMQSEGEFCFGNLVFKDLRNSGYIDKINDYKKTKQDKALSLGRP